MARTKHERTQQRKRRQEEEGERRTMEVHGGEEGRGVRGVRGEEEEKTVVNTVAKSALNAVEGGGRALEEGEVVTEKEEAVEASNTVVEELAIRSPREAGDKREDPRAQHESGDVCGGEEEESAELNSVGNEAQDMNGRESEEPKQQCSQATTEDCPQASTGENVLLKDTSGDGSTTALTHEAIDSLLARLESEIATRVAQQSKEPPPSQDTTPDDQHQPPAIVTKTATPVKPTDPATSTPMSVEAQQEAEKLRVQQATLQRLETELEQALRRAEMLVAENEEWKRAAAKQQDFRAEIHATHVLHRTQAAQLRRVAAALKMEGQNALSDAVPALHAVANALHPSADEEEDVKDILSKADDTMVFPAALTRSCACARSAGHWPLLKKEEDGDFSGEYAFRVYRLNEEPLKRHRSALLEGLESVGASSITTGNLPSPEFAAILKGYEHTIAQQFVYEPPKPKRRRIRHTPSSASEESSADDGFSSDTPLEVAFSAVDPTTPVHPGSEDAFLMVAL